MVVRKRELILVALLIGALAFCVVLAPVSSWSRIGSSADAIGALDFRVYYTAHETASRGLNPYNISDQDLVAKEINLHDEQGNNAFLYPPWFLAYMSPVLSLNFQNSVRVWLFLNLIALTCSGILAWSFASSGPPAVAPCFLATALFLPTAQVFYWGQVGVIMLFGLCLFFWLIHKKLDWLTGAPLTLLAFKPHLFLLLPIALLWWVYRERRYKVLGSIVGWFGAALLLSELLFPGILSNVNTIFDYMLSRSFDLKYPTLPVFLQYVSLRYFQYPAAYLSWLIPTIALVTTLGIYVFRRPKEDLLEMSLPLLCVSVMTVPYAWFYDQTVLLLIQLVVIARAFEPAVSNRSRRHVLAIFGLFFLISVGLTATVIDKQVQYFWLPPAMLLLWFWAKGKLATKTA